MAAIIAYPVLGATYLFDLFGGIIEGVFFAGFTIMVLLQLSERLQGHKPYRRELLPDHRPGMMSRWEQIVGPPAPR